MKWFIDIPTRAKLFVTFGIIIFFLAITIATAYRGITSIQALQEDVYNSEYANTADLLSLDKSENEVRVAILNMMLASGQDSRDRWHEKLKIISANLENLSQRLLDRNREEPDLLPRIQELNSIRLDFKHTREAQLIPLIYAGKADKARALALGIQAQRFEKMISITKSLEETVASEAHKHLLQSKEKEKHSMQLFIVTGALAILISLVFGVFLNSIIAKPLKEVSEIAQKVSSGDLTSNARSPDRRDEVGTLVKNFHAMVERLQKQTREITEAINVLASSSNEIAATTAQLASGTEQTSVAVSETTTTVEEVKQTANVSTQKARHVSDLAQKAALVSQTGAKQVNDTIEGINGIRDQMEYIAETIVKLSEHNQAIGEIISAVDDLSEQSNLLAVNASIEATKAGEQGKGFIVVAQEIKSLAEQSKQATKQVRKILNDIQKASATAVMATEKGSKAAEANVTQSAGTAEAMQEISRSVSEASQAVIQIATSNQQQLVGMDQVALAMANIKQASTQNAASTRQVETTVRSLQEIGQRLKKMTDFYKV